MKTTLRIKRKHAKKLEKLTKFGKDLKKFRGKNEFVQSEVAQLLGVTASRISEWERGIRTPKTMTQDGIWYRLNKKT